MVREEAGLRPPPFLQTLGRRSARGLARLLDGEHGLRGLDAFALPHDPRLEDVHVVPLVRVPDQVGIRPGLRKRGERLPVTRFQLKVRLEEHGSSLSTGWKLSRGNNTAPLRWSPES